jgi:hypothetical protein
MSDFSFLSFLLHRFPLRLYEIKAAINLRVELKKIEESFYAD